MKTSQSTTSTTSTASTAAAGPGRGGLGVSTGQRLPVPPRERRPALAALAVLLILGGALTSAYLVMASGRRVSAIRIAQPVAAGQQIPESALEEVQIGNTGIEFISWAERDKVTSAYAAVPLVKGALLTNGMVGRDDAATHGRVVVGLALKPGQLPAGGLLPGDRVSLYGVGGQDSGGARTGVLLAEEAIVYSVTKAGEQTLQSDQTMISVTVPPAQAAQVTHAASAGAVAVALVPAGTKVPGAKAVPARPPASPVGGQETDTPAAGQPAQPTQLVPPTQPTTPTGGG